MADDDQPTAAQQEVLSLARRLRADGDTAPLMTLLKDGREGPERVRDALMLLAELDAELIVQVALDALLRAPVDDHHAAHQTRRVTQGTP
jgi:hypothetical protein